MLVDALYIAFGLKVDEEAMKKADDAIGAVGGKLKTLAAGALAIAAPTALLAFAKSSLDEATALADAAAKQARTIGITTEAYQELIYAGELAGIEQGELSTALLKGTLKTKEAATGNKELAKTFRSIGLNAKELTKLSPDMQFEEIADAISRIPDEAERIRVSTKLFEEAGPKFASMFANGAKGIADARAEAEKLGLVISDEDAQRAELYNDSLARLEKTGSMLKTQFFLELLPILQDFLDVLQATQREGLEGNQSSMKTLAATTRDFLKLLLEWMKSALQLIKIMGGLNGALKIMAMIIASLVGAYGIMALVKGGNALALTNLKVAASAIAAAAPYIALAAVIFFVLGAFEDLWGWANGKDSVTGDILGDFTMEKFKDVQGILLGIGAVLLIILLLMGSTIAVVAAIGLAIAALYVYWDDLGLIAEEFFDWLIAATTELWEDINEGVDNFIEYIKQAWAGGMEYLDELWADFLASIDEGIETIKAPFDRLAAMKDAALSGDFRAALGINSSNGLAAAAAGAASRAGGQVIQDNSIVIPLAVEGGDPAAVRRAARAGVADGLWDVTNEAYIGQEG